MENPAAILVAKRGERKHADEEPQIYVIPPDGGESRRVSNIATGVSAIKWLPDSTRIAFISWVWPDCKVEKAQAKRLKERKDDKVKAHVVDHICFRHWDHWLFDSRQAHVHVLDLKTGKCRDLFAGSKFALQNSDPGLADVDISPDGCHIAFCFNPNKLVIHGALDYCVPDAQGLAYYSTLKALNVPSRLVYFPDENHWISKPQNSRLWHKEFFAWLEKYVGKGATKRSVR
ncbi:MAG: prolyl oligopeptidase family serine peptidase [Burkholderiales bacterium]|nr:prolyl oligopeptidase family serine peptidase [Burkholderiales bacterium]